jgi:hypothetical protein
MRRTAPRKFQTKAPRVAALQLRRISTAALVAVGFALVAQTSGRAQVTYDCDLSKDADQCLTYSRAFLVPGDYIAAGVDLDDSTISGGVATGTIGITGVPPDADIVGAYLYWEAITPLDSEGNVDLSQYTGVKFRDIGIDLGPTNVAVKRSTQALTGSTSSCWSQGTPVAMSMFRVDVLHFLPMRLDSEGNPTGKRLVNSSDLAAHFNAWSSDAELQAKYVPHTVALPMVNGNQVPESAGATLVVIYSDTSPTAAL